MSAHTRRWALCLCVVPVTACIAIGACNTAGKKAATHIAGIIRAIEGSDAITIEPTGYSSVAPDKDRRQISITAEQRKLIVEALRTAQRPFRCDNTEPTSTQAILVTTDIEDDKKRSFQLIGGTLLRFSTEDGRYCALLKTKDAERALLNAHSAAQSGRVDNSDGTAQ